MRAFQGQLDPTRNEVPGVSSGWSQELWTWTTTKIAQSWIVRATAGTPYRFDWGDGSTTWGTGNGADQAIAYNYAGAGTYTVSFQIADPTKLTKFSGGANSLAGTIPSFSNNPNLFYYANNDNLLTGPIPSLSNNPLLVQFYIYTNALTGTIPSLSNNTSLVQFYITNNALTGYTPSIISATCVTFNAQTNLLPQSAIDQILADFATGVAGRPAVGTITLDGAGNAAPSAAGLASKAAILAAKPGWTITHN